MIKAYAKHPKHQVGKTFRFRIGNFRLGRNFSVRRFSITEAAFLLLAAYIASKGFGVVRQALFNAQFGTGAAATAYYAAFRLPDTIFNLIAGGALTHAFIPVLLSQEKDHGKMAVWRLSSLVFNILLLFLVVSVIAGEFFAPAFVNNILVPGLPAQQRALTTSLTRIMLVQPLILGVGTILTAILHSRRQFFPSALAIAIYDLGPIGGLLVARYIPGVGIYGPAYGLIATALLQVAVQIPPLVKQGVRYTFTWDVKNPGLREVMRLLGPNVLNVIVASTGAIVITYFASYLHDKTSIAVMHNAYMLFALPLTLVGQTIGNALLPQLATQSTYKRYTRMYWTVLQIMGAAALLSVISAILLYVFGKPAIHILFQYGSFSAHATALTSLALIGYAVGLPGQTLSILLALCFYAIKDVRTPLFANIFGLGVQIGFSILLLRVFKGNDIILALPLAASISGTLQGLLLGLILYLRLKAKAKIDKGILRLQQRRQYPSRSLQAANGQQAAMWNNMPNPYQPMAEYQTVQPFQPVQTMPVSQPISFSSPFVAAQATLPQIPIEPRIEKLQTQPSQPSIQRIQPILFYEPEKELERQLTQPSQPAIQRIQSVAFIEPEKAQEVQPPQSSQPTIQSVQPIVFTEPEKELEKQPVQPSHPSIQSIQPAASDELETQKKQPTQPSQPSIQGIQPILFFKPEGAQRKRLTLPSHPSIQSIHPTAFTKPEEMQDKQPAQVVLEPLSVTDYQRAVLLEPGNLKALVQWQIAMMTNPGTERATFLEVLTRICRQLRNEEQSYIAVIISEYNQAAIAHPDNADVYFALGQIHQQTGNFTMANAAYKLAMSNSATEAMARVSASQCLLSLDKPEAAVQQLEQALLSMRLSSTALIDPAAWAARPRVEGEEHLAPEAEISMLLARAYRLVGRHEDTQAVLRQVKQVMSYQDEPSTTLAQVAVSQKNSNRAMQENALNVLNEVARQVPQDPRPHDELVSMYMDSGLLNEAIAELRDLAIIYLQNNQLERAGATMWRIGKIHTEVGDIEEALVFLHHAIEFIPGDLNILHELVDLYYQLGQSKEATHYQLEIAYHYINSHQVSKSIAALRQLLVINHENEEAYHLLGQVYQSIGDYDHAIEVYKNLALLDPENPIARERLATLVTLRRSPEPISDPEMRSA